MLLRRVEREGNCSRFLSFKLFQARKEKSSNQLKAFDCNGGTKKTLKQLFKGLVTNGNSASATGGSSNNNYLDTVTRYNMDGYVETLPSLLLGRVYHGCASFIQNDMKERNFKYLHNHFTFLFRFSSSLVDGESGAQTALVIMMKQRYSRTAIGKMWENCLD